MKRSFRAIALLCALVFVATACGSRLSKEQLQAGAGTGSGSGSGSSGTSGGSATTAPSGTAAGNVGTLKASCGPRPAGMPAATVPAGSQGVTADSIRIGVISDKAGPIPVPTVGIEESVKGFVKYCNDLGGINGRKLDLKTYDSAIFKNAEVTQQACKDNLFALVGDGSVQDQQGAQARVDCGLVEVAGYSATAERGLSDEFYAPLPAPENRYNTGPCKWMAKKFPDAVKHAAFIYTDLPAAANRAKSAVEACTPEGFDYTYQKGIAPLFKDWGPIVSDMKDKGIEYVSAVNTVEDVSGMLRAMADQGFKPKVIDLGQQYYDPKLLADGVAEGAYVLTNTDPFEELSSNPALQLYENELKAVAPGTKPTSLGVQAFSAGLMFAQATKSLGDDLTHDSLVKALDAIHTWDGGGLHMVTDPGNKHQGDCFLYLQVKNSKFTRLYPSKGYDCSASYEYVLKGDYGTGAKKKAG